MKKDGPLYPSWNSPAETFRPYIFTSFGIEAAGRFSGFQLHTGLFQRVSAAHRFIPEGLQIHTFYFLVKVPAGSSKFNPA